MSLESNTGLVAKLINNEKFRDSYVYEHVKTGIAYQMRALREQREWTQAELGAAAKKPRNVITRLEDPSYGKLSLKTLLEMASAFNVALLVKFVPFSKLLDEYDDVSPEALAAKSIHDTKEVRRLKRWAAAKDRLWNEGANIRETPARTIHSNVDSISDAAMLFLDKKRGKPKKLNPIERPSLETVSSGAQLFQFPKVA